MWRQRLMVFAAALWWGGSGAIGFLVVPLLFANLPTRMLAGNMAARMFSAQSWLALACGLILLLCLKQKPASVHDPRAGSAMIFIVGGMLLALLVEYAVAPRIVARENLRLWHGVGSAMYLLQWFCAGAALWWASARPIGSAAQPLPPSAQGPLNEP